MTKFKRFFGEQYAPFCYTYIAESETANKNEGAFVMKNRKTIFTIIFALVLALSIVTVSAAAISANETKPDKPATKPDAVDEKLPAVLERNAALGERVNDEYDGKIAADEPDMTLELNEADFDDACPAEESYAESIKGMRSLTEKEKAALLADLAEIESLEAQIDELYYRMTDENADRLYGEIDALCEKLDAVLDRNAELWDRVDAEYDEKIAAIEPDMPFELEEDDLAVCEKGR